MKKIKVIYYNSTLLKGGTDTYMLEVVRNIDKEKFEVDVLIKDGDNVDKFMLDELSFLGSKVFLAKGSFFKRMMFLRKFFKENKGVYDVCHINATSQGTGIISYFAKKNGRIAKIVFHSHMGGNDNNRSLVDKIGARLMAKHSTDFASCSNEASEFMFGKDYKEKFFVVKLNNAVDAKKFAYNPQTRKNMREELGIGDDEVAILHIGRFAPQKNHKRLIEIFAEVRKTHKAKLLLIGAGDLVENIKNYCKELKVSKDVMLFGIQNNVSDYMQAADCFVMPSLHEGLPIVAVEAQAAGLPCLLSSNISTETKLADYVQYLRLEDTDSIWAHIICTLKNKNREIGTEVMQQNKFDNKSAIKIVEELYKK